MTSKVSPAVSVAEQRLDQPISCISFSPQNDSILVVGTYQLLEGSREKDESGTSQIRTGKIYVIEVIDGFKIRYEEVLEYGVLHLAFAPTAPSVFAVATSIGRMESFILNPDSLRFERLQSLAIADAIILVLHLEWCPHTDNAKQHRIALSLSDGRIATVQTQRQESQPTFVQAHILEAWFVAWDPLNAVEIYSGGDDAYFCVSTSAKHQENQWTDKSDDDASIPAICKPIYCNKKIHQAGVTSILPYPREVNGDKLIFTGSYDENLRVLRQKPRTTHWQNMLETPLNGGVWRLQMLERPNFGTSPVEKWSLTLLASCMHAGPKIMAIEFDGSTPLSVKVLAEHHEHASMNYASDARSQDGDNWQVVSSSFYDKKLCLWNFDELSRRA